jgi:hypothetical protein
MEPSPVISSDRRYDACRRVAIKEAAVAPLSGVVSLVSTAQACGLVGPIGGRGLPSPRPWPCGGLHGLRVGPDRGKARWRINGKGKWWGSLFLKEFFDDLDIVPDGSRELGQGGRRGHHGNTIGPG